MRRGFETRAATAAAAEAATPHARRARRARCWLRLDLLLALGLSAGAHCGAVPSGSCVTGTSRCDGHVAQICDADHGWRVVMDCDKVGAGSGKPQACVATEQGSTCKPAGP